MKTKDWRVCPKCLGKKSFCAKTCMKCRHTIAWNKGMKGLKLNNALSEWRLKGGTNKGIKKPQTLGERNGNWSGDKPKYNAVHMYVRNRLGVAKDKECVYCGSKIWVEWANVSGNYTRELSDWIPLCRKCHHEYDDIVTKMLATKKKNISKQLSIKSGQL